MTPDGLAIFGAAVAVSAVVVYYVRAASVIRRPKLAAALDRAVRDARLVLPLGFGLSTPSFFGDGLWPLAGIVGSAALAVGLSRQGVRSRKPGLSRPPSAGEWAVVLPDGATLSLDGLFDERVVRVGPVIIVGCELARSVAAFESVRDLSRGLPLDVGFELQGGGYWDVAGVSRATGFDGVAGPNLTPVPVTLRAPDSGVIAGAGRRLVRIPGASDGSPEDTEIGAVRDSVWSPLDGQPAPLHLARWAARRRGEIEAP